MNETILAEYEISADADKINVKFLGDVKSPRARVEYNGVEFFDGPASVLLNCVAGLHNLFDKLSEVANDPRGTDGQAPTGTAGSGPSSV